MQNRMQIENSRNKPFNLFQFFQPFPSFQIFSKKNGEYSFKLSSNNRIILHSGLNTFDNFLCAEKAIINLCHQAKKITNFDVCIANSGFYYWVITDECNSGLLALSGTYESKYKAMKMIDQIRINIDQFSIDDSKG